VTGGGTGFAVAVNGYRRAMTEARTTAESGATTDDGRGENDLQRLDRNFNELLQELRVAQTGVQILFAFLLTVAFSERFSRVADDFVRTTYVATVVCTLLAAGFLIAPVGHHRVLFRRRMKDELVANANRLALAGLFFLALALGGSVVLVLEVVVGRVAGVVAGAVAIGWLLTWWFAVPYSWLRRDRREDPGD
jgi:hypothetical protein